MTQAQDHASGVQGDGLMIWARERLLDARTRREQGEFDLYCRLREYLGGGCSAGRCLNLQRWVPLHRLMDLGGSADGASEFYNFCTSLPAHG